MRDTRVHWDLNVGCLKLLHRYCIPLPLINLCKFRNKSLKLQLKIFEQPNTPWNHGVPLQDWLNEMTLVRGLLVTLLVAWGFLPQNFGRWWGPGNHLFTQKCMQFEWWWQSEVLETLKSYLYQLYSFKYSYLEHVETKEHPKCPFIWSELLILSYLGASDHTHKKECIPVGCIPTGAWLYRGGGRLAWGWVVCLVRGCCVWSGGAPTLPLWTEWNTPEKNITFPALLCNAGR